MSLLPVLFLDNSCAGGLGASLRPGEMVTQEDATTVCTMPWSWPKLLQSIRSVGYVVTSFSKGLSTADVIPIVMILMPV